MYTYIASNKGTKAKKIKKTKRIMNKHEEETQQKHQDERRTKTKNNHQKKKDGKTRIWSNAHQCTILHKILRTWSN